MANYYNSCISENCDVKTFYLCPRNNEMYEII
jgi:hypothetical protein